MWCGLMCAGCGRDSSRRRRGTRRRCSARWTCWWNWRRTSPPTRSGAVSWPPTWPLCPLDNVCGGWGGGGGHKFDRTSREIGLGWWGQGGGREKKRKTGYVRNGGREKKWQGKWEMEGERKGERQSKWKMETDLGMRRDRSGQRGSGLSCTVFCSFTCRKTWKRSMPATRQRKMPRRRPRKQSGAASLKQEVTLTRWCWSRRDNCSRNWSDSEWTEVSYCYFVNRPVLLPLSPAVPPLCRLCLYVAPLCHLCLHVPPLCRHCLHVSPLCRLCLHVSPLCHLSLHVLHSLHCAVLWSISPSVLQSLSLFCPAVPQYLSKSFQSCSLSVPQSLSPAISQYPRVWVLQSLTIPVFESCNILVSTQVFQCLNLWVLLSLNTPVFQSFSLWVLNSLGTLVFFILQYLSAPHLLYATKQICKMLQAVWGPTDAHVVCSGVHLYVYVCCHGDAQMLQAV